MRKAIALSVFAVCAWVAVASAAVSTRPPRAGVRLGSIEFTAGGLTLRAPLTQGGWSLYTAPWPVELDHGPAHYRNTPLPWQEGTSAFAGHRTTFTKPFGRINYFHKGDRITLHTPYGVMVYAVYKMKIVLPTDIAILHAPRVGHRLLLTACHPPHQATYRIAVWSKLVKWTR